MLFLRRLLLLALLGAVALALLPARAEAADPSSDETEFLRATNADRADAGVPALQYDSALSDIAREWTARMVKNGALSHRTDLVQQVEKRVTTEWVKLGENVGAGGSVSSLERAFMNSSAHRGNILNKAYNRVGIGTARSSDGRLWVTVNFLQGPVLRTCSPGDNGNSGFGTADFALRNTNSTGSPMCVVTFGDVTGAPLACDWNGDGVDTPGIFKSGRWTIRNSNTSGSADITFSFGTTGDVPVCGDWDGNGKDSAGIKRGNKFFLRNALSGGAADISLSYGQATDVPVVGDWNGDGKDTFGIRRGNAFYLRNKNSSGVADITLGYGSASDTPVVGDFNGDGVDSFGVRRGKDYYLRNSLSSGPAQLQYSYGNSNDLPVVGDWDGNGVDSPGAVN